MRQKISRYALITMAILLLWFTSLATPCFSLMINLKPVGPDGKTTVGDNWMLIIGINSYHHWLRLRAAEIDAKTVRNMLLERYHFSRNHIIELYNEQCTEKNIITKLNLI